MTGTVLVLPTPRVLLPPSSLTDPVAELRAACTAAVERLPDGPVTVLAAPVSAANAARGVTVPLGHRVAAHLLGDRPFEARTTDDPVPDLRTSTVLLVMADGSARRGEKAPGHLHPAATGFDDAIERALRAGDAEALAEVDASLATELWCEGAPAFHVLGELARGHRVTPEMTYADAPFGVAWWVARWDLQAT